MTGLVQSKSIDQVNEEEKERLQQEIEGESEELTFGALLYTRWTSWKDIREPQELQWLANLRQFNSIYDADKLTQIRKTPGRSETYVGITRMKVMAAYSRLVDILFPVTGKKHWELKPTPDPTLAETATNQGKNVEQQVATGIPDAPQINKPPTSAEEATKGMSKKIQDQLLEGDYDLKFLEALLECVILGTGCIKNAQLKIEKDFTWVLTEDGWKWMAREDRDIKPKLEQPSIFDVYPDPDAATVETGLGVYQRHVYTKHEFRELKKLAGFRADVIDDYIIKNSNGNHTDLQHEVERKGLAHQVQIQDSQRYDILEFWGHVDGIVLRSVGVEIAEEDLNKEFMANIWTVGSVVIKGVLDTSIDEGINYYLFPYEKVSKRIWGKGVPEICSDSQEILNAAARRLLDDVALSGPQFELNTDDATVETIRDADKIHPYKVWFKTGGDPQTPLLRVYNVDSVSRELGEIISMFRRFIDEELNLPTVFSGETEPGSGVHGTAQGLSMLMSASNIVLRSTIKNIDKYVITPFIKKMYMFNMQWSDDEDIKGDMQVNARGSSSLIAKEIQSSQLINALNITNNPTDLALTKRDNMLRMVMDNNGLDPDDIVKTPEEIQAAANDPVKQQLDNLALQKATLENQLVEAQIDKEQSEVTKNNASIDNDVELLRLKGLELRGKEEEAAAQLELQEKKIDADIELAKKTLQQQPSKIDGGKLKKVAGETKTTVGATRKESKNDGLKGNNKK